MTKKGKLKLSKRDSKLLKQMLTDWQKYKKLTVKQQKSVSKMRRGCNSIISGKSNSFLVEKYDTNVIDKLLDWAAWTDWLYEDKMDMWREFDQRLIEAVIAAEKEIKTK